MGDGFQRLSRSMRLCDTALNQCNGGCWQPPMVGPQSSILRRRWLLSAYVNSSAGPANTCPFLATFFIRDSCVVAA